MNFAPYENTSPTLDTTPSPTLPPVVVRVTNPAGTTVASLLGTALTDPDPGSVAGIAITGTTGGSLGAWQYSIDGGTSWSSLNAAAPAAVRLLRAGDLVRFLPQVSSAGTASLLYRGWDQTAGTVDGTIDTLNPGGTSSLSAAVETATVVVMLSNIAPTLATSGSPKLADVREDAASTLGTRVSLLLGSSMTDPDSGTPPGIAVVGVTGTLNGRWEYSPTGETWTPLAAVAPSSAVLLAGGYLLRFVPGPDFNGPATISYAAWDQSSGLAGGTADISAQGSRGGSTAFSVATATASVLVASVNDAPRLVAGASALMLKPVAANSSFNATGTPVATILNNAFLDVDGTTTKGVALIETDESNGTFYFNIAGQGGGWFSGGVSAQFATLFDATDQIAFVPNAGFTGMASIQFRLWDKTTSSSGFNKANLSAAGSYGGETAFGADVVTATVFVGASGATPTATFTAPTSPNAGVSSVAIAFSAPVSGVDVGDFSLSSGGAPISLAAASLTGSGTSYVIDGLGSANPSDGIYTLTLNAVNSGIASSTGVPFASAASTSWRRQSSPSGLAGVPGDAQVALSWTAAPASPSAVVTDYVVQFSDNAGGWWTTFADGTSTATAATVTGLTNGTSYLFRVAAVADGVQSGFAQSGAVTPRALPASPTRLTATPGNARVSLSWAAPASNGGSAITDYVVDYSTDSGFNWTTFPDGRSTATSATVNGLVNGTGYLFRVSAVTAAGPGSASGSAAATPITVPGLPDAIVTRSGSGKVSVAWTAPAATGGSQILDYVVQFSGNSGGSWATFADGTSTATSTLVTGLTNGTSYIVRVAAVNAAGQGGFKVSQPVTPLGYSRPPLQLMVLPGDGAVSLAWAAPTNNGGSAITDYFVQVSGNAGVTWDTVPDGVSTITSARVTGLVNGGSYLFRVTAVNSLGPGGYAQSLPVRPRTIPAAPTGLVAVPGNQQVSLSWTSPAFDGGSPVVDYVVQSSVDMGVSWTTVADTVSPTPSAMVTGLTNGLPYAFRVLAVNAAGQGGFVQSDPVVPRSPPSAPATVAVLAGIGRVRVTWTPPASSGGAPVIDYIVQYSSNSGESWSTFNHVASTATVATVTRLVNGTAYLFRVAAVNAAGAGGFATSSAVRPRTVRGVPTNVVANAVQDGQVALSWTAPAADGGAAITSYFIECNSDAGGTWTAIPSGRSTAASTVMPGLVRGRSYLFRVAAMNAAGKGASALSTPLTT